MSARTLTGALALVGGALLVVSLFVSWYDPGVDAWTAFEVLDLVLAAAGAYGAVLGASIITGDRWPLPGRGPLVVGGAAFVIVVLQLVQPPPAVHGADLRTGAWLGLVASAMLVAAGWLATGGRTPSPPGRRRTGQPGEPAPPPRRPPPPP
jgi:hypothetical protein